MVDILPLTGKNSIFNSLNSDLSEYLTGVYSRGSVEETKSWLRKLIRRKVLSESSAKEYKAIVAPQESPREKTRLEIECVYPVGYLYVGDR